MADGYVLIEINTEGEARIKEDGLNWLDFRLKDVDFDACEGLEQLHGQLPEGMKDALVLVVFDYVCNTSYDSWTGEYDCEELFNVVTHQIMKNDYKEFSREVVTLELKYGIDGYQNIDTLPEDVDDVIKEKNYYKSIVANWEAFYDEDFVPFEKKPKKIESWKDAFKSI